MNFLKKYTFLIIVLIVFQASAQVSYNNQTYKVKGSKIYIDNEEVTSKLSEIEKEQIYILKEDAINADKIARKIEKVEDKRKDDLKAAEKAKNKLEKKHKKSEKALKKHKKELKNKAKAQKKYSKAEAKLEDLEKKYTKLKRKGKLSVDEETKYLDKIESYKKKLAKAKKKLRKT